MNSSQENQPAGPGEDTVEGTRIYSSSTAPPTPPAPSALVQFLSENWLWILAPAVIVGIAVLALWAMTPSEGQAPFTYALF